MDSSLIEVAPFNVVSPRPCTISKVRDEGGPPFGTVMDECRRSSAGQQVSESFVVNLDERRFHFPLQTLLQAADYLDSARRSGSEAKGETCWMDLGTIL